MYEALAVPVLIYNSSALEKFDKAHRRHLRSILNYRYPNFISNDNLYKRCNAIGHVPRGPTDGPAYSSLRFAVNTLQLQGRRGRPQSNLFSPILKDPSVHRISLNSLQDLDYLRNIAQDRAQWRRMQHA